MIEALFYKKLNDEYVQCELCNHFCRIAPGNWGICAVRKNRSGVLESLVYGRLIAMHIDPIEKKPLFHMVPGHLSYSIATVGCNFRCLHCQNADISQMPKDEDRIAGEYVPPEEVVEEAKRTGCKSIAYTYTEPTIFFEYAYDVAKLASKEGLMNVFVSNGYMSEEAIHTIAPYLDGINVDLKGDGDFYKKVCGAKVEPVRRTIELLWEQGIWTEVTTLIIPGYNNSDEQLREIADFLAGVSTEIPWHVSAFYPTYKLRDAPPTTASMLRKAINIGKSRGLKYIYGGNIAGEKEDTNCPVCNELLVKRFSFRVAKNSITGGKCPKCGEVIPGRW